MIVSGERTLGKRDHGQTLKKWGRLGLRPNSDFSFYFIMILPATSLYLDTIFRLNVIVITKILGE